MQKDIILFGMQGAGKGTQAKLLLENKLSQYKTFEPGQILRALKSNDNAIGESIVDIVHSGKLLDDQAIYYLFEMFMFFLGDEEYPICDGFPRNLNQMYYYLNQMHLHSNRDFVGIFYDIPREVAIERLLKRAQEQGRIDDTPEVIATRIDVYEKETFPVIDYLESIGKLVRVDATQDIDTVFTTTCKMLEI